MPEAEEKTSNSLSEPGCKSALEGGTGRARKHIASRGAAQAEVWQVSVLLRCVLVVGDK